MMKCGKYAGVKIIKDNITKCRSNTSHLVMKASLLWFKVPTLLVEPVEAVYTKAYWRKAKVLREKAITFGLKKRSNYCNSLLKKIN